MRKWLIAFVIFFLSTIAFSEQVNRFRVGVLENSNNQGIYHVASAVWENLSRQLSFDSTYQSYTSINAVFNALRAHKVDVVVGPVKAQPRIKGVVFLSSYINDEVGVFIPYAPASFWQRFMPLLRIFGSTAIIVLIVLMIIVALIVWAAERKHNPQFANRPFKGIGDGFWFAIVTMTTVGYGDKSPITFLGRFVTTIWLFLMLFLLSAITAVITAELTGVKLAKFHSLTMGDLRGQKVVLLQGSRDATHLARYYHCRPIVVDSLAEAIKLLEANKVAAGFLNRVNTRYYIHQHPKVDVQMTGLVFQNGRYAFAMRSDDKRVADLDEILLLFDDSGQLSAIEKKVLGLDHDLVKRKMQS